MCHLGRPYLVDHQFNNAVTAEAWLLTLVEVMPQMIWRAVGVGSWTWSSPQWQQYTGQTSEESSAKGWLSTIHPDDQDIARASWKEAPDRGEFHADLRIRSRLGTFKWFQTRGMPVRDQAGGILEWIGTSTDVDDLRQLQAEQRVLVAELQHRTRNLIAVVHSICMQTLQRATSIDEFRDNFENRLSALSRVQGLLSTSEHEPITLKRLLEIELHALADGRSEHQVVLNGPDTIIRNSTAQTLALAVHELATNALKYGALSSSTGRLDILWYEHTKNGQPWLCLRWQETGSAEAPGLSRNRSGYGHVLIEQILPRQLGAQTRLVLDDSGLCCIIDLPLRHVQLEDLSG